MRTALSRRAALAGAVAALSLLPAQSLSAATPQSAKATTTVSIALSWTPNTDYTGVYVANELGYYKSRGIAVKIIPYASTAPETLVAHGRADFAFSYQAGIAYAHAAGHDVVGVFVPDQKGTYAIGVRANNTAIRTPKDLDGKTYAGFGSPDELPELQYVIKHAGGKGVFKDVTLNTSAYDAVYGGRADFTIPAVTWEGVQAKLAGKPLKYFRFEDYGFPAQYSNVIASSSKYLKANADTARAFLAATQQGYAYAASHPHKAAALVIKANPGVFKQPQLVYQSQALLTSGGYLRNAKGQVGPASPQVWKKYGNFLYSNGLLVDGNGKKLTSEPDWSTYYTNAYLPAAGQ